MAKDQGKKDGKGKGGGKGNKPVVLGPYDQPYLTQRQIREEQRRRAAEAVEPLSAIESRYAREREGATRISESFQEMLARQAAQNLAAQQAIQAASGGAGSALTTGAVTATTQEQAAVPKFAAGEGVRLQRDVTERESEARRQRQADFRKYLAGAGEDIRSEEKEKQAARIERAAAAQAYNIDLAKLNAQAAKDAQKQSNWERSFALQQQREDRLASNDTGNINDLIPTIDDIATESSVQKGGGGWMGTIQYEDPRTGETAELKIEQPVDFDPKGKSLKARQNFWRSYVASAIGVSPQEIAGTVGTGALARGEGRRPAATVAKEMLDYLQNLGYSKSEAYQALMKTRWGGVNAKAVAAAMRG